MHHPRSGQPAAQRLGTAALAALALTACMPRPEVTPSPYAFSIAGFTDVRSAEARLDAEAQPFPPDVQQLQAAILQQIPPTRWGARPAQLYLQLQHFETSQLGTDRALSIALRMHATDAAGGYDLGTVNGTCSVTGFGDANAPEQAITAAMAEGLPALHPTSRAARQWGTLVTQCSTDLVRQLRNRLLQPPKLAQ